MRVGYFIRLDDACETMDLQNWLRVENILNSFSVKPIVAVVPDNQDSYLNVAPRNSDFWNLVRSWSINGWTIAMHGYQHKFHYVDRNRLMLPFYDRSEFGGLSLIEQRLKIRASLEIFNRELIEPTVWVAPAHCFDAETLKAIKYETKINVVSDGFSFGQFYEKEFYWLPQQLWHFKKKIFGTWTICLHPNTMSGDDFDNLEKFIKENQRFILDVKKFEFTKNKRSITDKFYWKFVSILNVQKIVVKIKNQLHKLL